MEIDCPLKQTTANLLKIESTTIEQFPGDVTGDSIVATASGSAEKGETAQIYGGNGIINNPATGTIGLRINKGSLDIVVGQMNYNIPLPENQGETLLYSTDASGALKGQIYLNNDGTIKMDSGVEDLKTLFAEFIDEIKNIVTTGAPNIHTLNATSKANLDIIKNRFNTLWG